MEKAKETHHLPNNDSTINNRKSMIPLLLNILIGHITKLKESTPCASILRRLGRVFELYLLVRQATSKIPPS